MDRVLVSGNTAEGCYNQVIALSAASYDSIINANVIRDYNGYAIRLFTNCNAVSITGNTLRGMRGTSPTNTPIAGESSNAVKTAQNIVLQDQTRPVGILYSGTSTGGMIDGNLIAGFATPVSQPAQKLGGQLWRGARLYTAIVA
ncbi:hypothetical protein E2F48_10135 [Arthrobacter crusticola]|uniref:Right handed beta helix domain-containing protein n=1 Tax=Arthrobacter crusticola TaxID=2547960 RepID=A0A4R5TWQ5_9MICC|nr:hypothetical protein E2F48_10135 [Arthrobacter crusticola]